MTVDNSEISVEDWRAHEHYAILCAKTDGGAYADCKKLCWEHASRIDCDKSGQKCSKSHKKEIPAELAKEFLKLKEKRKLNWDLKSPVFSEKELGKRSNLTPLED